MYIHGFTDGTSREVLDMKVTKAQAQANAKTNQWLRSSNA